MDKAPEAPSTIDILKSIRGVSEIQRRSDTVTFVFKAISTADTMEPSFAMEDRAWNSQGSPEAWVSYPWRYTSGW